MFDTVDELAIGKVVEVEGSSVQVELGERIDELSRSYQGRVYAIGQVGSIIRINFGRTIILGYTRKLRMEETLEEIEAKSSGESRQEGADTRYLAADLLGEGTWSEKDEQFNFQRGVETYPLPGQTAYLTTVTEVEEIYRGAKKDREQSRGPSPFFRFGEYHGTRNAKCELDGDTLFGQHSAVLGSTGTGKSAAVASILHRLLDNQDQNEFTPHVVLLDPHGEYSSAFGEDAEVFRAYNTVENNTDTPQQLRLPYWLMNGEEFRDLVIGKTEFEATSENNIVYRALLHARLVEKDWIEEAKPKEEWTETPADQVKNPAAPRPKDDMTEEQIQEYSRDTPDPFCLDEFQRHIRNEQGMRIKRGEWKPESPSDFQSKDSVLKKLQVLRSDPRLSFLMGNYDGDERLADIIRQFITTENGSSGKPLKIVDMSGLPNEVAGPLTATIARLLFEYKTWQTRDERRNDPILFVCEEAHRYVPNQGKAEYEAAQTAIRRLAKEGRKYGIGLMAVSQRPGDLEETVLSQCNSWIVLRLTNPRDQQHVKNFVPDNFSGLIDIVPALGRREAIVVGQAAAFPARVQIDKLSEEKLPDSEDISFVEGWSSDSITEGQIEDVIQRWRNTVSTTDI